MGLNLMQKKVEEEYMPVHVLQFFSTLNNGGAENRMMDVYRCIDPEVVKFDFAVVHEGEHFFDKEIFANGSEKYVFPDPRKGLIKNYKAMVKGFRENEFSAIHTHVAWYCGVVLMAAKKAGIPVRIAHARNAASPDRKWKEKILCNLGKLLIKMSATQKIAISEAAAEHIFGKDAVKNQQCMVIPNAIDQKKYYVLNEQEKIVFKQKLGIPIDKKVYVTVANFRAPKNHKFLLDIANALKDKNDNFVLYLIGDGELREEIEEKIIRLGLSDNVILLGSRKDVPEILSVFDAMIFPSLYEGLGGVVLEAQLAGVPAIVSDAIPKIADVGIDMVEFVSLKDSPAKWADTVIKAVENNHWEKEVALEAFKRCGYCIEDATRTYLKEYGIPDDIIDKAMKK